MPRPYDVPALSSRVAHELVQKSLLGEGIDAGPVAVFVADDDQRYIAVNTYACELLGYTREEILGLRVGDVAVNEGASSDYDHMQRSGSHTGLTILRRKDGGEVPMHFRAGKTELGGMPMWVGVCWPVGE